MDVRVDDLTVTRGGLRLLEGVRFAVPAGCALALRGPNGSGKTTLLRTLAGLQPATKGSVAPEVDAMAYAGHADGIKATLTVAENLTFWAAIHGTSGIDGALDAFALKPLSDRPAGALSAGQKRRLGLARLLVTGRPVWLLDEPTVSLDTTHVGLFAEAVAQHLACGGTAIIATHIDLGLAAESIDVSVFRARADAPDSPADSFDAAFG